MGFSLRMFIEELKYLLINEDELNIADQLCAIRKCIEENEKYAKDCGDL